MQSSPDFLTSVKRKSKNTSLEIRKDPSLKNFLYMFLNQCVMNFIFILFPKIPVPTVFTWDVEGPSVYVSGDWDEWQRHIPLCPSELDFSGLIPLFPGEFVYIFSVDGKWKYATVTKIEKNFQGTFKNSSAIGRLWKFLYPNDSLLENRIFADKIFLEIHSKWFKKHSKKTNVIPPHYITFINYNAYLPVNYYRNINHFLESSFSYKGFLDHIDESNLCFHGLLHHIAESSLSFHGYWNHIFFFSIKDFSWKIDQELPSSWTRNKEKGDTKIFCSNKFSYFSSFYENEKLNNNNGVSIDNLIFVKKLAKPKLKTHKFSVEKLNSKEKIINWRHNRLFDFLTKCFC
mmetsp:Transcript_9775/g.19005  ORF Transcript_9775/g.19005 Transcript_9775/m.19005 type:complete len:345 (+) Transcript_9775:35-1069(+)